MTLARAHLVPHQSPGIYHCVQRCVRRAFLCGEDAYTGQSFEHRKQWIEKRIIHLANAFGVSLWGFAVMSNHLHLVIELQPDAVNAWPDEEVARRWVLVFPAETEAGCRLKEQAILAETARIAKCRARLASLSWFMRCLAEPIARMANAEDHCSGRFWQGRFKSQALLDERALLAAMAYVDLNPIRAGLSEGLHDSQHTSIQQRIDSVRTNPQHLTQALKPVAGLMLGALALTEREYADLVDWTGRQMRTNKQAIANSAPSVLNHLGFSHQHWVVQVKAIGSGYFRVIGSVQQMQERAQQMNQRWLQGIGLARKLEQA